MKTTLDEMQVFIAIVDSGSITAAAEVLGQTVSATSRTMSRLEEKLQTTLMRRTTRRLALTEEGKAYLEQARRIIASVEEAEELMNLRRNQPASSSPQPRPAPTAACNNLLHAGFGLRLPAARAPAAGRRYGA